MTFTNFTVIVHLEVLARLHNSWLRGGFIASCFPRGLSPPCSTMSLSRCFSAGLHVVNSFIYLKVLRVLFSGSLIKCILDLVSLFFVPINHTLLVSHFFISLVISANLLVINIFQLFLPCCLVNVSEWRLSYYQVCFCYFGPQFSLPTEFLISTLYSFHILFGLFRIFFSFFIMIFIFLKFL